MVLAGPGSGKTRVITYRISHLIRQHTVRPGEIVAITFTNKAANEMRARVGQMLPERVASSLKVSTFHALCARLLRRDAPNAGLDQNYSISDEDDAKAYVIQSVALIMDKDPKEVKGFKDFRDPNRVRRFISKMKQQVVTPDGYNEILMGKEATDADVFYGQVYDKYQSILTRNNCVDFDDLIMKTVLMFREHEDVRDKYSRFTRQLLVDEYQDTNKSQYELVRQLSSVHGNVMVVGDLDQSIYRFRGAEPKNLARMESDYGDALQTFFLEENFRSTPQIAEVANVLIGRNTERKPKLIKPVAKDGPAVRVMETLDPKQEAAIVVQEMMDDVKRGGSYKDFAILYRVHAKSRLFEELMVALNIPHKVIGGLGFYNRAVVKDILAYLKLLANGADEASFIRIYNKPTRGFGDVAYGRVCAIREEANVPILHVFRDRLYEEELAPLARRGAEKIREAFIAMHALPKDQVAPIIEVLVKEIGYLQFLKKDSSEKGTAKLEHLEELMIAAKEFDTGHGAGLLRFLEWVALMQSADDDTDENRVHLMTCHAAKGLEFPKLYVIGAIDGLMPIVKGEDDFGRPKTPEQMEADLQEERRIFFVALTRAERRLTITHTAQQFRYNKVEDCTASRFLMEIGDSAEDLHFAHTNVGSHLVGVLNRKGKGSGRPGTRKKYKGKAKQKQFRY